MKSAEWHINQAGLFSTIQDRGRFNQGHLGLPQSGVLDRPAMHLANRMVGNASDTAVIETTLTGLSFETTVACTLAITGAIHELKVNDQIMDPLSSINLQAGDQLKMGSLQAGARAYIAVAGGFDVPEIMGSSSTLAMAGLGGWQGRALKQGDVLPLKWPQQMPQRTHGRWLRPPPIQTKRTTHIIRAVEGPEYGLFDELSQQSIWRQASLVSNDCDRMGMRLTQTTPLHANKTIHSGGIVPGSLQVTPKGDAIMTLNDSMSTGGYPRILQVHSDHIHLLAQIKPGDQIHWFRTENPMQKALQNNHSASQS